MVEFFGSPLPALEGHVSRGRFERVLRAGNFALTAEMAPPDSADAETVYAQLEHFDGVVDSINATDGSGGNCHMSSLAVCALLSARGYSPILQISCRDRNRIAIQGDVLGAAALSISNVLCLTGDDVGGGDHPQAKPVFDLDSMNLLNVLSTMRDKRQFVSGRAIHKSPELFIGASANPFVPPQEARVLNLAKKISVGAQFIQTQYCFDVAQFRSFMNTVVEMGLDEEAFILPGIGILSSAKSAKWIKSNVPGVHIPDVLIRRLEEASDQAREGRKIAVEILQEVSQMPGVHGAHIMAYRQERYMREVVSESGVLKGREPWTPTKFKNIGAE